MRVKPSRPGLVVGVPGRTSALAQGGEEVPRSSYWMRRLRCHDVVSAEQPAAPPAAPAPTPATKPTTKRKAGARRRTDEDPGTPES